MELNLELKVDFHGAEKNQNMALKGKELPLFPTILYDLT